MTTASFPEIQQREFRTVLGHFPTGVCVVTAMEGDEPIGMVVGSFTSVSLDPPLVAFLADRSSSTFPRIREATSFCVNVLAADQESLCRAFATRGADRFSRTSWRPAPSGAPILENVVAWIDCVPDVIHEAGDHYIYIGRVTDLAVENPTLPLLFFQGGYGAFSLGSLVMGAQSALAEHLVLADRARDEMTALAKRSGIEVLALVPSAESFILVASASPSGATAPLRIGTALPFAPPAGRVFVAWAGRECIDAWYARSPVPLTDAERARLDIEVDAVRRHGWTPAFYSDRMEDLWETLSQIGRVGQTPMLVRHAAELVASLERHSTPEDVDEATAGSVQSVMAPVFDARAQAVLMLSISGIPRSSSLERVEALRDDLLAVCARVTDSIGGRLPPELARTH